MTDSKPHPDPELAQKVEDIVWASDRAFFESHPGRHYRLRPSWDLELKDYNVVSMDEGYPEESTVPPPGYCWWTAVYQGKTPGLRTRLIFAFTPDAAIDPPEHIAKGVVERLRRVHPKFDLLIKSLDKLDLNARKK